MRIYVPIHSLVDVITNSSTVIYTWASSNAIKFAKELIDEILATAGSDKTADDLFEFSIKVRPSELYDWLIYDAGDYEEVTDIPGYVEAVNWDGDWKARHDAVAKWADENDEALQKIFDDLGADSDMYESPKLFDNLIITTKDGAPTGLVNKAMAIFESDAITDN